MLNNERIISIVKGRTISNKAFHIILIIAEYMIFVFPYVVSAKYKMENLDTIYSFTKEETIFQMTKNIKGKNNYHIYILIIGIFLLILYYIMTLTHVKKSQKYIEFFYVNLYNIFFLRYFSFIFYDGIIYYIIYLYLEKKNYGSIFIEYISLGILFFYSVTIFSFINRFSVYLNVDNTILIKNKINYPFDIYSLKYEKRFFFLKLLCSIESNHILISKYITNFSFALNFMITLYSLLLAIEDNLSLLFWRKFPIVENFTNVQTNYVRRFLIIFNFFICFSNFFFRKNKSLLIEIIWVVFCLSISVLITVLKVQSIRYFIFQKNTKISQELYCFLLSKDLEKVRKKNELTNIKNLCTSLYQIALQSVHFNYCIHTGIDCRCKVCSKLNDPANSIYDIIYYFYKSFHIRKRNSTIEDLLVHFFHSKIQGNIYQTCKYFYQIKGNKNTDKSIINLLDLVEVERSTSSYSSNIEHGNNSTTRFLKIIKLIKINEKITENLEDLLDILNKPPELQTMNHYLHFSRLLASVKHKLYGLLCDLGTESKDSSANEMEKKNKNALETTYRYNLIVSRYIIETLTNMPYTNLSFFNIEYFEDSLSGHYNSTSFIMLSSYINDFGDIGNFDIVTMTGFNNKNIKIFSELLPKEYSKLGNDRFLKEVTKIKSKTNNSKPSDSSVGQFNFVIKVNNYLEHFCFRFNICQSLINHSFIVYGNYFSYYTKTIVLEFEKIQGKIQKIHVISFSRALQSLFKVTPDEISRIREKYRMSLTVNFFFKNILAHREKKNQNEFFFECELSLPFLTANLNILQKFLSQKRKMNTFIPFQQDKSINQLLQNPEVQATTKLLRLEKIIDLGENIFLYRVMGTSEINQQIYDKNMMKQSVLCEKRIANLLNTTVGHEGQETSSFGNNNKNYNDFLLGQTCCGTLGGESTNSATSISSVANNKSKVTEESREYLNKMIIKKESRLLTLVSTFTYIFNGVTIILCIVFLVTQITSANNLKKINLLFFNFKTFRITFNNLFYTIISLTCMDKNQELPLDSKCENKFLSYFTKLQKQMGFTDYSLRDYFYYDVVHKTNTLKTEYEEFKGKIYSSSIFSSIIPLLSNILRFNQLEERNDVFIQHKHNYTLSEAIEVSLNDILILIGTKEDNFFDTLFPLIGVENKAYSFSHLPSQHFNSFQHSLYRILTNSVNFGVSFNLGEELILEKYINDNKSNEKTIYLFMVIFILFNLILLFLYASNIRIGKTLFFKMANSFVVKLEDNLMREGLKKKVESLITMSKLYKEDPVRIINKLDQDSILLHKEIRLRNATALKKKNIPETENNTEVPPTELRVSFDPVNSFNRYRILPLYYLIFSSGVFYSTLTVILDLILINEENSLDNLREYANYNFDYELTVYSSVFFVNLIHVFNSSDFNLAKALEIEPESDGLANYYIRRGYNTYGKVLKTQRDNNFIQPTDVFPSSCNEIYNAINDSMMTNFHIENGLDDKEHMFKFQRELCIKMNYDALPPYYFYEDYFAKLQVIHNQYIERDLDSIYDFFNNDLYYIYCYLFFFIQPFKQSFDKFFLLPMMNKEFNSYTIYALVYLVMIVIIEGTFFLINKLCVIRKLNTMKNYLFLISDVLNN